MFSVATDSPCKQTNDLIYKQLLLSFIMYFKSLQLSCEIPANGVFHFAEFLQVNANLERIFEVSMNFLQWSVFGLESNITQTMINRVWYCDCDSRLWLVCFCVEGKPGFSTARRSFSRTLDKMQSCISKMQQKLEYSDQIKNSLLCFDCSLFVFYSTIKMPIVLVWLSVFLISLNFKRELWIIWKFR